MRQILSLSINSSVVFVNYRILEFSLKNTLNLGSDFNESLAQVRAKA